MRIWSKINKKELRRRVNRAKPLIFVSCFLIAVLMLLGSTLAWFTAADEVLNPVRREELSKNFEVVEVDVFPPNQDYNNIVEKRVGTQNIGDLPAFVRIMVLPVFKASDGSLLPAVLGQAGDPGVNVIVTDFNLATWNTTTLQWEGGDWALGGDGYYYYLNRLDPDTSTDIGDLDKNLFNHLRLVMPTPAGYSNATLIIEVKCEAVEPKHYREAWWGMIGNTVPASPPIPAAILPELQKIDTRLQGQIS